MPAKWFICPDGQKIEIADCLKESGCRMSVRCASRSYLRLASSEREWTGKPSCTQLLAGTMLSYLRLTQEYSISPDQRAFAIHGTKSHSRLEMDDEYSYLEEKLSDGDITGIVDAVEVEAGKATLIDYKTSGSYKVAKALGIFVADVPTGEVYKSGPRKGEEKTTKVLKRDDSKIDRWDWELQLNFYRMQFEKTGYKVDDMRIHCIVRDGNTWIARSRGVYRNIYYFAIPRLTDDCVTGYFANKRQALMDALKHGWEKPCSREENWDGVRCSGYCEVAEFCSLGKYLKKEKEIEDMPIKGLSDIRRLPRLGKIALGEKVKNDKGVEYPRETKHFVLRPNTPSELENQRLVDKFHKLYGEQPNRIKIMLPVADPEMVFPQYYKRYGKSTLLQCKGDGETALCVAKEYAEGLEILKQDNGNVQVKCLGKECLYYKDNKCSEVGVLQVLLPELEGAGVWQIVTGSFHSIVNINSGLDYISAMAGRFNMIPLTLERVEQEIQHEGKKTKHYILHLNMGIALAELQRWAQIDATKILLELPEAQEDGYIPEDFQSLPEVDTKAKGKPMDNKQPDDMTVLNGLLVKIAKAESLERLHEVWTVAYPVIKKHPAFEAITKAKDEKKAELQKAIPEQGNLMPGV
jgi:hypothetical protein